jgi:N-glycosylase/DNA lyase
MNTLKIETYNLNKTLLGGQSFSWEYIDGTYWGIIEKTIIKLKEKDNTWYWQTYPQENNKELVEEYFRTNIPYQKILKEIDKDEYVHKAILKYPGLRLLNMPFEQTVISFIISQNKNIPAIRSSIKKLSQLLGEEVEIEGQTIYTFPTLKDISTAPLELLRSTGVGYRAEYLKNASNQLLQDDLSLNIQKYSQEKDIEKVRELLTGLHGIGNKVADCIMSYSLDFLDITPLDVWAKRFCNEYYCIPTKNYLETSKWLTEYFGKYTAYAGQYLFEYIREEDTKRSLS